MRLFLIIIITSISIIISSCGGGTDGTSYKRKANISLKLAFENSRMSDTSFFIDNTEIGSVTLGYENSLGDSDVFDITSAASNGSVELTELIINEIYTFKISAYGADGAEVCTGSASIEIIPDIVNNVDIECSFEETYAIENAVYSFVNLLLTNADSLTAESIDPYVAEDFGTFDGMTRSEFIADFLSEDNFDFTDPNIVLTKVDVISPDSRARAAGTETFVKMYFSDGSVFTERIWVVKENGKWVLAGNDRKYEIGFIAEAFHIKDYFGEYTFSGISAELYDPKGVVSEAVVSGTGLSSSYIFTPDYLCDDCDSLIIENIENQTDVLPLLFHTMLFTGTSPTDPVMTVQTTYEDGTTDTVNTTVYGTPVAADDLTPAHFVTLNSPTSLDIVDYINQTVTFSYSKPTAYTAAYIEYDINLYDGNGSHFNDEGSLPLNGSSIEADFTSGSIPFVPMGGELHITAYDSENKAYTTSLILYNSYIYDPVTDTDNTTTDPGDNTSGDTGATTVDSFAKIYETNSYTAHLFAGKYLSEGQAISCGSTMTSGEDYSALVILDDGADSNAFSFAGPTASSVMEECLDIQLIDTTDTTYGGYMYLTGTAADMSLIVNFIDADGNMVWSKKYGESTLPGDLYPIDTHVIDGNDLLVMLSDYINIYFLKIDDTGNLLATYEISSSNGYELYPMEMKVSDTGDIAVVGQYYEYGDYRAFLYLAASNFTSHIILGREYYDSGNTIQADSTFESVEYADSGELIISGYVYNDYAGDLILAKYDPAAGANGTFSTEVYDNYSTYGYETSFSLITKSDTAGAYYLSAEFYNSTSSDSFTDVLEFSYSGDTISLLKYLSLENPFLSLFVNEIDLSDDDGLYLFGSVHENLTVQAAAVKISADGQIGSADLTAAIPASVRYTDVSAPSLIETAVLTAPSGSRIFSVLDSNAGNILSPITSAGANETDFGAYFLPY